MGKKILLFLMIPIVLNRPANSDSIPPLYNPSAEDPYYKIITEKLIRPFTIDISGLYLRIPVLERFLKEKKHGKN